MKLFFRTTLLLLAMHSTGLVVAQSKLTEEQKKELHAKFENYKSRLNLTEVQQEKVKAINATYFEGLAGIKESGGSKLSKLKAFRKLSDKKDVQMKGVLDKNQYDIYKKMQKEMKEELKSKRAGK
jgi:hypothetical protein